MKRTEKILIIIWLAFFLLKGVDYIGSFLFFVLATFALSLYYLVACFKLFKVNNSSSIIIPILAGLSLSTSLVTIPFNIFLRNWEWLKILPFINIIFTVALVSWVTVKWIIKTEIQDNFKPILFRCSIVLLIASLFAFRPTENQIYRNVVIYLNAGNEDMISNMRMFDNWQQSEEHLEKGNCEEAIEYSLQSFKDGLKWLRIDSDTLTERDRKQLRNIHGTYTNVYKAYLCKADKLYDSKKYKKALYYHLKADSFLNINPVAINDSWKVERADSKNGIGVDYAKLSKTDSAISFFTKAIIFHTDSIGTLNIKLATYLTNFSESLADGQYWTESNQAAEQSILVLNKASSTIEKNDQYSTAYLQLVYNALAESKLSQANQYLSEVEQFLTPKWECKHYLFRALLSNRLDNPKETLKNSRVARDCYSEQFGDQHQNIAESYSLSYDAWMKIPDYDSAIANLKKGIEITRLNHGITTVRYHDYIKREGYYHYSIGNYNQSLKKLLKVKKIYERDLNPESDKLPEVLATIGRIKIEQEAFNEARNLSTESLNLIEMHDLDIDDRAANLLNDLAYICYATNQFFVADTLYNKSIELNKEVKKDSSLSVANALNGLGLIAMKNSHLSEADSLFNKSLQYYKLRTSKLHPDIGIVLMNQSELSFKSRNFSEALELVNQALDNFTPFHRDKHPTIGDMYLLKASILSMNGDDKESHVFLTKALEIFESNFDPEHKKIKAIRNRLEL